MGKAPRIEHVTTASRDDKSGELTITFSSGGVQYNQSISKDVIQELLTVLCSMPSPKGGPIALAALIPENAGLFENESTGIAGLMFQLSAGWGLPIAIPKEAIPSLHKNLDQLELFYSPTKGSH